MNLQVYNWSNMINMLKQTYPLESKFKKNLAKIKPGQLKSATAKFESTLP